MKAIEKIRTKITPIAIFVILFGLWACSGKQANHMADLRTGRQTLDTWLEDALIPYLLQQFGQHPRFKGQPILLVGMQGDEIRTRVDDLTAEIRAKIINALLKEPGLDLAWRPIDLRRQHYQSLEDVACGGYRKAQYYVGLDCGLTRLERRLYVKVRALNLAEQKWVSGFGKSWEGLPTAEQLAALVRVHPDVYLRGQRPLPFSDGQPDLLADYLARNLSCLLRQTQTDDLVLYVSKPNANAPAAIKTTLELVAKYLARLREVEITDDPNQANVTLVGEIHTIHRSLHQIWISVRYRHDQKYLPGAETEAYVLLDAREQTNIAGTQNERPAAGLPYGQPISTSSDLIVSFDLLTPSNPRFCLTGSPWQAGVRRMGPNSRLATGGCLAVEMSLAAPAYVFLVGQDASGELTQMFPAACVDLQEHDALLHAGPLFQFPSLAEPNSGVLKVGGSPGLERVFAIAVASPDLADRLAERLQVLQGLCRPGQRFLDNLTAGKPQSSDERIYQWQDYLNRLSADNPAVVQWRGIGFWHEPN